MDFLTVFYCPVVLRYILDPYLHPVIRRGTSFEVLITLYFHLIVAVSIVASTALAVCRYIRIKFPFYTIKKMRVIICCIIAVMTQLAVIILYTSGKKDFTVIWLWYSVQAFIFRDEPSIAITYLAFTRLMIIALIVFIGIIASVLSVLELRKSSNVANSSKVNMAKSSRVIVSMNIYNAICVLGLVLSSIMLKRYPAIFFLSRTGLPIIGAAFNPTVRVMVSKDILKYCKSFRSSDH